MTDGRLSLGEVLHVARQAGGGRLTRPVPAGWADRDPRLRVRDEKMAAAVEAVMRERIGADLMRLAGGAVPGVERDVWLAARQVVLHGLAKRGDESRPQP